MPLVPDPKNCDISVKRAIQGLSKKLGYTGSPTYANVTLTDLMASSLVGTNASKLLESVTIGSSLSYVRPTLNTIQDIRTTASPTHAGLTVTGNSVFGLNSSVFQPATNSTTFFQVLDADGGTPILNVDTTNERIGIGTATPTESLHIVGAAVISDISFPVLTVRRTANGVGTYGAISLDRRTATGNAPNGFGIGQYFRLTDGGGTHDNFAGFLGARWNDATTGSEIGELAFTPAYHNDDPYNDTPTLILTAVNNGGPGKSTFNGSVGFGGETAPETLTEWTDIAPYLTLHNSTHEDTDGGRESRINFKGEQGVDPFEETTLARIEVSHDGSGADDKGKIIISVNDGDDGNTPTQALEIGSDLLATFAGAVSASSFTGLVIGTDIQAYDAGLLSLAGLTYVSDSFIKVIATDTYAIRTITETKTDLSLNLVENTALSTWAGTTNITTLGTIATGVWEGTSIAVGYTDAKCTEASPDYAYISGNDAGTGITATELEELSDGSETVLHSHAGLEYVDRGNLDNADFVAGELTLDNLWHELDLSGIIPVNTKLVFLRFSVMSTVAPKQIKLATNGSDSGYNALTCCTQVANVSYGFRVFMYPTAARKIQYLVNAATWISFEITVVGWFV